MEDCQNTIVKTAFKSVKPFLKLTCYAQKTDKQTKKNQNHCFGSCYVVDQRLIYCNP